MSKPKCPLKFRLQAFEGGEECDPECAWCMTVDGKRKVCAVAVISEELDEIAAKIWRMK